jgi:formylglycine-generating enzyme required for sulfatase activity
VSAWGVSQLGGNGWEWTSSVFAPFEGFQSTSYYPGYSADFFDGHHYVVKGASARTAAQLTRRSFRNWYRSEYPYTYTGFRLVEN